MDAPLSLGLLPRHPSGGFIGDRHDLIGIYQLRIATNGTRGRLLRSWPFVLAFGNHFNADPAFAAPSRDSSNRRHVRATSSRKMLAALMLLTLRYGDASYSMPLIRDVMVRLTFYVL